MEYFLGSVTTFILLFFFGKMINKKANSFKIEQPRYSQSYIYTMLMDYNSYDISIKVSKKSQATNYIEETGTKVFFIENEAYWISNNQLYVANTFNGLIDEESIRQVDTMAMDTVQLKKTMLVVEKLREGKPDEDWNSGQS